MGYETTSWDCYVILSLLTLPYNNMNRATVSTLVLTTHKLILIGKNDIGFRTKPGYLHNI